MSKTFNEWCEWFKDIEVDPHKNVQITVGELYEARVHVSECEACNTICETIDKNHPPSNTSFASEN